MVIIHSEQVKPIFKGTIIDIETIGDFCRDYYDSRRYQNIIPVIFGYISENTLKILCAEGLKDTMELRNEIFQLLPQLRKPLFAFNCCFERGVLFHSCRIILDFDGELNEEMYERKEEAVAKLGIDNYDDPFHDIGFKCKLAWDNGEYELSIKHNRSCLRKERAILLKRGFREPDNLPLYGLNDPM